MDPLSAAQGGGGAPPRPEFSPEAADRRVPPPQRAGAEPAAQAGAADAKASEAVGQGHLVSYALDDRTRELITRLVDRKSGEVVREVPPKELREVKKALEEASKRLFDRTA